MLDLLATAWVALRRQIRRVWFSRGGGYYGLVAALTWVYLEAVGIAGDLAGLTSASLSLGWVISFLVSNFVAAILNGIFAAIWPLKWLDLFGVGAKLFALLGGTYVLYIATRPAILRLLGAEQESAALAAARSGSRLDRPHR